MNNCQERHVEIGGCHLCFDDIEHRGGQGIFLCGSCEKGFHLDCVLKLKSRHCPYCAQPMNSQWPQFDNKNYLEEVEAHKSTKQMVDNLYREVQKFEVVQQHYLLQIANTAKTHELAIQTIKDEAQTRHVSAMKELKRRMEDKHKKEMQAVKDKLERHENYFAEVSDLKKANQSLKYELQLVQKEQNKMVAQTAQNDVRCLTDDKTNLSIRLDQEMKLREEAEIRNEALQTSLRQAEKELKKLRKAKN